MGDHGPINLLETVVPAVLGLTAAAILSVTVFFCARRIRRHNKKANPETALTFQAARRPLRSPSGGTAAPPHYLKKSPSPTTIKSPPGTHQLSPQEHLHSPLSHTHQQPLQHHNVVRYTEEREVVNPKYQAGHDIKPVAAEKDNGAANGAATLSGVGANGGVGDETDSGKLGTLVFKLRYLNDRSALVVTVVRCRGLPGRAAMTSTGQALTNGEDGTGRSQTATDPYVKLQLLPEKQHKVKTRVVRNTRNPSYDEDFTFYGLSLNDLQSMSLHFVVLSFDRYSRDDVIGEVHCPFSSLDLNQIESQQVALSKEIQPRSLKIRAQGRGELLISLCWQPAAARLTVVLLKARNLPRMDVTGLADPYVKIYLLYNGQRIAKKKTHIKKRTLSPVFNESFAFDIPMTEGGGANLEGVSLELMLLDWDRVTKNEVIGRLELGGQRCAGTALNHWNEVCNSPRRQIAEWHKLNE